MAARPRQVEKQIADANRLIAEMNAPPEGQAAPPAQEPTPPAQEPTPPAQEPTPPAQEPTPPAQDVVQDQEDWKHKYEVLSGKYNAEVPRLSRQVVEQADRTRQLEELLSQVSRPVAPAVPSPSPTSHGAAALTPEEIAEWSPELVSVISRVAQSLVESAVGGFREKINTLESGVGQVRTTVQQDGRAKLFALLDRDVKDWQTVNTSQPFLQWLDQRDPYSGSHRGSMLREAFEQNDGERVKRFFNGFLQEHTTVTSPGPSSASNTPAEGNGKATVDLASLAAPGRTVVTTPQTTPRGAQNAKRVYSSALISKFYEDIRRGVFKGREQERVAIERDIVAAGQEGRIVN